MESKVLLAQIEEATSHELSAPNEEINAKICYIICSKPDMYDLLQ